MTYFQIMNNEICKRVSGWRSILVRESKYIVTLKVFDRIDSRMRQSPNLTNAVVSNVMRNF